MKPAASSLAGAAILALVLTACGSAAPSRTIVGETTTPTLAPLAADDIVWQVVEEAGFTTLEFALSVVPLITVYADGRVIVQDANDSNVGQTPIQLREGHVTPQQVEDLRQEVAASGLFGSSKVDLGSPAVSDAGVTVVRAANAQGDQVTVQAYALGLEGGLGAHELNLRRELSGLIKRTLQEVPETTPMTPTRLAVIGFQGSQDSSQAPAMAWPGTSHAEVFGEHGDQTCALLPADETAAVYSAALQNPGHHWRDVDGSFYALVKIALPGTPPCPT